MGNSHPDWKAEIRKRLHDVSLPEQRETEIVEELAQDLEERYAALMLTGVDADRARQQVLDELADERGLGSNLVRAEIAVRPARLSTTPVPAWAFEPFLQDVRYSVRVFSRRPGFVAVAVLAIGLGIASITAVFSLINVVLLGPLPASQFDRVVLLWYQDLQSGRDRITLSPFEYQSYASVARSFDGLGAIRGVRLNVDVNGSPSDASGIQVTRNLLDTLGVQPVVGRAFSTDGAAPDQEALVTYEFWQRHLGADRAVLGKTLSLRAGFTAGPLGQSIDGSYVVVGVLPPQLSLPYRAADIWIPFSSNEETPGRTAGGALLVFGRLRANATLASASAEVATIAQQLSAQFPERSRNLKTWLVTLREETVGDITPTVILLAASVALLGVIVCANIGNMLLVRMTERLRELALKRALGASRGRIVQQLLTESAILGVSGGLVGVALAHWLTHAIAVSGPATIPRIRDVTVDGLALVVALGATLLMTAFFGVIPALRVAAPASGNPLSQRTGNTGEVGRLRNLLTIAQFALAFVVLAGSGLAFTSSLALQATPTGYDPASALTFRIALPQTEYSRADTRSGFFRTLLDRLRAHPGIVSAGGVNILPQMDTNGSVSFDLEGSAQNTGAEPPMTRFRIATPGYFESLGIAVLRGRSFQESDVAAGGVVVSRSMADRFWPRIDPVGRRLRLRLSPTGQMPWLPVVGVVEDVRQWINSPAEPTLYWANLRQPEYAFVVRTSVDPTSLAGAVTQIVRQIDPRQPVFDMHSMQERLDRSQQITYERFRTKVMAGFGCAALLLAGIGIYGVVRHSVIQRTPEFGIRMALGASSRQIFAIVLLQSLRSTVVGSILGFLGSFALGRSLSSVLYGGGGFQPLIMAGVALVLGLLATAAALGPARLAARVDPMQSFRSE